MPRDGSGVYSKAVGTTAIAGTTIESAKYNAQVDDMVADLNAARPITAGGTGATTASQARSNLGLLPQLNNIIVNPAMQLAQETGGAASGANGYFAADQWNDAYVTSAGVVSYQIVGSITPKGSSNRLRLSVTTADTSLAAGEFLFIQQKFEAFRVGTLGWNGTTGKQLVLRFGFKGPAGTYSVAYQNAATNRSWVTNFTVTAPQANTDLEFTKVIPADTTGGTWPSTTTAQGSQIAFVFAAGSTFQTTADAWQTGNFFGTSSNSNGLGSNTNVFELFDVGLYSDPDGYGVAPAWVAPNYADALRDCQRYWQQGLIVLDAAPGAGGVLSQGFQFGINMRTGPSITLSTTLFAPSNIGTPALTGGSASSNSASIQTTATAGGRAFYYGYVNFNARM